MPSTIEEALNSADIAQDNTLLVIDNDLRTISIPDGMILGVFGDDDTHRLHFQMPKEYSGIDLSGFSIRINYTNAAGNGDAYIVDDSSVNGDTITFSWLVGRNAYAKDGTVNFVVCLRDLDGETIKREFNTTVASLPVLRGLETTNLESADLSDLIEQISRKINVAGGGITYSLSQDASDGHILIFSDSNGTSKKIVIPDNNTVPDLAGYAKKSDIPDVSAYQTADQVNTAIEKALSAYDNADVTAY